MCYKKYLLSLWTKFIHKIIIYIFFDDLRTLRKSITLFKGKNPPKIYKAFIPIILNFLPLIKHPKTQVFMQNQENKTKFEPRKQQFKIFVHPKTQGGISQSSEKDWVIPKTKFEPRKQPFKIYVHFIRTSLHVSLSKLLIICNRKNIHISIEHLFLKKKIDGILQLGNIKSLNMFDLSIAGHWGVCIWSPFGPRSIVDGNIGFTQSVKTLKSKNFAAINFCSCRNQAL